AIGISPVMPPRACAMTADPSGAPSWYGSARAPGEVGGRRRLGGGASATAGPGGSWALRGDPQHADATAIAQAAPATHRRQRTRVFTFIVFGVSYRLEEVCTSPRRFLP